MTRARSPLLRRAVVLSLLAHGSILLVGSLTLHPRSGVEGPPEGATAEMIFVDPGAGRSGAKATVTAPSTPAPPKAMTTAPASPADPLPGETAAAAPAPPLAPDAASPSAPAHAAAAPAVRLGDDGAGSTSNVEGGDIPAGPDPAAPNIPPRYPPDAARRGEEGVVVLEVAVAADGDATGVGVYVSSGFARLDRAARDAVARWRFKPKLDAGLPTSSRTLVRGTLHA